MKNLALIICILFLSACSGGDKNSSYSISGAVKAGVTPLSGVTVVITGTASGTAITNADGNYSFSGLQNGNYTVTPSKAGYSFISVNSSVIVNNANSAGNNFVAITTSGGNPNNSYSISGTAKAGATPLSGVTIVITGTASGTANTDADGNYSFSGLQNGNYTLTPSKVGYSFISVNSSVVVNNSNSAGNNFVAISTQVAKTGQTTTYAAGDDGALGKGVTSPAPRFIDNGNGTVTDNLTGLTWLKNANCADTINGITKATPGYLTWLDAINWSNGLSDGSCGLTDSSVAGDWRLPNFNELESLIDMGNYPALPAGHPFINIKPAYWTSTTVAYDTTYAWYTATMHCWIEPAPKNSVNYVLPVRD